MTCTPVALATPLLDLTFDAETGLVSRYALPGTPEAFRGGAPGTVVARVTTLAGHRSCTVPATLRQVDLRSCAAVATYDAALAGDTIASFALRWAVQGSSVLLSLEDVVEAEGHELIQVDLPNLVRLDDGQPGAWIAHGDRGGVRADLSTATPCELAYSEPGDFPNFSVLPLVLLGYDDAAVAMEVTGYLSNTALVVAREGGTTTATIGATAMHRVPGGPSAPSLLVEQAEILRLDFSGASTRGAAASWIDVARLVKARMPARTTAYFDDKFMYAILGQLGPSRVTEPQNTFAQVEQVIERVWHLTDAAAQVVFVAGWPDGGHDTAYPNVATVNPRLGGQAGWDRLQRVGRKRFDANVTLDDNYDDQYDNEYTRGVFDESFLARDRDGAIQVQEAWNGVDMSQITGFAKYMVDGGPGRARALQTIDTYGVDRAMLIDAMSWWSVRNDWDPKAPASAVRNLRAGKFALLDYFADHGVAVGSEVLTYPFVGHLPFTMDGPTGSTWNGFGGTAIPLLALVYRAATIYGGAGGGNASYPDPATSLFHNNRAAKWLSHDTPDEVITGMFYLHYLPWMILSHLEIEGFGREGAVATIALSDGYRVVVDEERGYARVVQDGVEIMAGRSISAPLGDRRLAFYAEADRALRCPLPAGVTESDLRVERLLPDGRRSHPFQVTSGVVTVNVPAFAPVIASW